MSEVRSSSAMIRQMVPAALFAALTGVCSQIAIPLTVPINLALFSVHLAGALLGPVWGGLSQLVYLLLGLIGIPVFSSFRSGPGTLFGVTGGYIIGYFFCAVVVGLLTRKGPLAVRESDSMPQTGSMIRLCCAMAVGVVVCYAFGTAWFMVTRQMTLAASLSTCVLPFLPGDAVKIVLAAVLTLRLRKPFRKLGLGA